MPAKPFLNSLLLAVIMLLSQPSVAKRPVLAAWLRAGDIIFQKLACGPLCQAILEVTPCTPGAAFNHCGILQKTDSGTFVIEAMGATVHRTVLDSFLARDTSSVITIGRVLVSNWAVAAANAPAVAARYIGRPYDDAFLPGDSALYCSELIYEAYRNPQSGKPLFPLKPMTFRSPGTATTFPGWQHYYDDMHIPVPEGVPGINPCAIANSPQVTIYKFNRVDERLH